MHSNLARHLHTEECVKLIDKYEECMKQVFNLSLVNLNSQVFMSLFRFE